MNRRIVALLAVLGLITHCRARTSSSTKDGPTNPNISCDDGFELAYFSLRPMSWTPTADQLDLPEPGEVLQPNEANSFRLELCLNQGTAEVQMKGISYIRIAHGGHMLVSAKVPESVPATGLAEAVFGQEDVLNLDIPPAASSPGFRLIGKNVGGKAFVLYYIYDKGQNGQINVWGKGYQVGLFEYGDVMTEGQCDIGENSVTSEFTIGTARFETTACLRPGGGDTFAYRFLRISVQDSNEVLTPAQRQPVVIDKEVKPTAPDTVSGGAAIGKFLYFFGHHNSCDAFSWDLGHVAYAFRSASTFTMNNATCTDKYYNAPGIEPIHGDPIARVRYGHNDWQVTDTGEMRHYLTCAMSAQNCQ
ncbi:MAG: hypothetical protein AB7T49_10550 [Oligoflexales bacterium]